MTRALSVLLVLLALVLPGHAVPKPPTYRVEGAALSAEPAWPAAAGQITVSSTDAGDNGELVLLRGLSQSRVWQEERVAVGSTSTLSYLRLNREYWLGAGGGPLGDVTLDHPTAGTLATIEAGKPSAFHAFFSVGQGRANLVLDSVTGAVTHVMHRRGQAPQSEAEVSIDGDAPGVGDFWIEGTGFVSADLEAR